ncbi:hypothetical protein LJC35_06720 [Parabacteroides sp. OttesenSCG-928-N08]|nr:hypothetical protein [Parabacteroides sp. OttesenSCG-928-N08]
MRIRNCVWLVLLLFLASCEIELGENYVEVERPSVSMEIKKVLSSDNAGEVIEVDDDTWLQYQFDTDNGQLLECTFSFPGQEWYEGFVTSGRFLLQVNTLPKYGDYQLTCRATYTSNKGSIASQLYQEEYESKLSWTIRYVEKSNTDPLLRYEINEEGQLVVIWDNSTIDESRFRCYELRTYWNTVEITDFNQTSYVIKEFFGQECMCSLVVGYKDMFYWVFGEINISEDRPTVTIEERDGKQYLTWDNRYKRWVTIEKNYNLLFENYTGQELEIVNGRFGAPDDYYKLNFHAAMEDYSYAGYMIIDLHVPVSPGKRIETNDYDLTITYCGENDMIYTMQYSNEFIGWQLPEFEKKRTVSLSTSGYNHTFSNPSTTNLVAIYSDMIHSIQIYDEAAKLKQVIPLDIRIPFTPPLVLTDDNKVVTFNYEGQKGYVYDIESGSLVKQFDLTNENWWQKASFSPDYTYFVSAESETSGLQVTKYKDLIVDKKMTMETGFSSWCVHPTQHNRLFVSRNGKVTEYNMEDLSVVNSFLTDELTVVNIDPKTGYMLLTNTDYAVVVNPDSGEELFRIEKHNYCGTIVYYGNTLISEKGHTLNLDDKIK